MPNLNKVMLMGNLTRDVELKYTPSGQAVAQLGLAINRKYRDSKSNELREEVTFVTVEVWGKQAETAHQYLAKGRPLFVDGRLKLDQWDDKNTGQKMSRLKVVCERFEFLGGGGQGAASGGQPAQRTQPRPLPPRPGNAAPHSGGGAPPEMPDQSPPPEDLDIQEENIPF
jgi:single-strand DNA-binding protein